MSPVNHLHPLLVVAQIGIRRGDPDAPGQARADRWTSRAGSASRSGSCRRSWPASSSTGSPVRTTSRSRRWSRWRTWRPAPSRGRTRRCPCGSTGSGCRSPVTDPPEPFSLELAGDTTAAATHWQQLGADYPAALALVTGTTPTAGVRGSTSSTGSGRRPRPRGARRRLRAAGVRGLDRARRTDTLAHPAGLTRREQEVLVLLADGRTNDEIAAHLVISPKTVDHHVSAVLGEARRPQPTRSGHRRPRARAAHPRWGAGGRNLGSRSRSSRRRPCLASAT